MKTVNKLKTEKGGKGKMEKVNNERKIVEKNAFGFKKGSNRAIISDIFLDNEITLQNAAKKVEKALDKAEVKAVSMVLGMVKSLLKRGHKVEVTITAIPKKNDQTNKGKSRAKVPAETISEKVKKAEEGVTI